MKKMILRGLVLSSLVWMAVACTNTSTTTAPEGPTPTTTAISSSQTATPTPATLTFLYNTYINANFNGNTGQTCAQCHSGLGANGVNVDASSKPAFYSSMVGQPSGDGCASAYVVANSTSQSTLYLRLAGSCGSPSAQMPLGETPLNATQLAQFASWINSGAPNN